MLHRVLVASYTNDIVTLGFDPEKADLAVISSLSVGHHPSWITSLSGDSGLIVTGLEESEGKLLVLKYDAEGRGEIVADFSSGGSDPCSLLVINGELLAANYSSGSVSVLPISNNPPYLLAPQNTIQFSGIGPNKSRQDGSHPHQVIIHPQHHEVLVPDLGADMVRRLKKDANTGAWQLDGHIAFEAGSGPRHVAFYGGHLFTLLELSSRLVRHKLPPSPGLPTFITSTPTMSEPLPTPNDMLAAEILIPPTNHSFPTAYLYLSNRNDPSPDGDIISIFSIEKPDSLELIKEVRSGLRHLRGMVFGGPDDRYLIAGGANGGGVKVFERIDNGRDLRLVAHNPSVAAPTGFEWLQT